MANSQTLYNQMQQNMKAYEGMGPLDVNAVGRDIGAKVDFFRPELQELQGMRQTGYAGIPQLMQQYSQRFPTGGLGAMAGLSSIMNTLGQNLGRANVFSDILNQKKAGLQDIVGNAVNMYGQKKQGVLDKYGMLSDLYKSALSTEEAAKQRAFQQQQAAASRAAQERLAALQHQYNMSAQAANRVDYSSLFDRLYGQKPTVTRGGGKFGSALDSVYGLLNRKGY